MLLAIDMGNTSTSFALFEGPKIKKFFFYKTSFFIQNNTLFSLFKKNGISRHKISEICIASVVPRLTTPLKIKLKKIFPHIKPLFVSSSLNTSLLYKVEKPKEIGADRIANAVAAFRNNKKDLVVIDFGTATTFDYISKNGEYHGGIIVPGIEIAFQALFEKAAKLKKIKLQRPKCVIGKNTKENIQSGFFHGYGSLVDGIISKMKKEVQKPLYVIATGGFSSLMVQACTKIHTVDPYLTLKGIQIVFSKNA